MTGFLRLICVLIALAWVLAALVPVSPAGADTIVVFPDANLEKVIREVIKKPAGDIYQSDLENITSLSASNKGIKVLNGLEYCTGLKYHSLPDNLISDISPVTYLTELTLLSLKYNQISNILPLLWNPGIDTGDVVNLENNPLSMTSREKYLPQLSKMGVKIFWTVSAPIGPDTAPTAIPKPGSAPDTVGTPPPPPLTADGVSIIIFADANVEAVIRENIQKTAGDIYQSDLQRITNLWAENRGIKELTGLEYCTRITGLDLNNNQIADITPLSRLTNLRSLDLASNQIRDISPLVLNGGIGDEDHITLSDNPLNDMAYKSYLPQLKKRGVIVAHNTQNYKLRLFFLLVILVAAVIIIVVIFNYRAINSRRMVKKRALIREAARQETVKTAKYQAELREQEAVSGDGENEQGKSTPTSSKFNWASIFALPPPISIAEAFWLELERYRYIKGAIFVFWLAALAVKAVYYIYIPIYDHVLWDTSQIVALNVEVAAGLIWMLFLPILLVWIIFNGHAAYQRVNGVKACITAAGLVILTIVVLVIVPAVLTPPWIKPSHYGLQIANAIPLGWYTMSLAIALFVWLYLWRKYISPRQRRKIAAFEAELKEREAEGYDISKLKKRWLPKSK